MFRNVLFNEKRNRKKVVTAVADTIRRVDWNRCGGMPDMPGRNVVLDQFLCVWRGVEEYTARVVTLQTAATIRRDNVSSCARGISPRQS